MENRIIVVVRGGLVQAIYASNPHVVNIDVLIKQKSPDNRALENLCCIFCGEPVRIKGEVNG